MYIHIRQKFKDVLEVLVMFYRHVCVFFSFLWPFRFCPFHEVGHPLSEGRRVWYHMVSGVSKMERCGTVKVDPEHVQNVISIFENQTITSYL